jgi:hypothetical protein
MFNVRDPDVVRWMNDLLTTKAKQGKKKLGSEKQGYCCLGRQCVVLDPRRGNWAEGDYITPSSLAPEQAELMPDEVSELFADAEGEQMYTANSVFTTANDKFDLKFKEIPLLAALLAAVLEDPPEFDAV